MKPILILTSLFASAFAQSASIVSPLAGSNLTHGTPLTIEVDQATSPTDLFQVAIVLGLTPCLTGSCDGVDPSNGVGDILYSGSFLPQRDPSQPQKPAHQVFTVEVPENGITGAALLSLTHLSLTGARHVPNLEFQGVPVTVV